MSKFIQKKKEKKKRKKEKKEEKEKKLSGKMREKNAEILVSFSIWT